MSERHESEIPEGVLHDDLGRIRLTTHLADALSWQVAAQLIRRHPRELWVINSWPLDGFYDCLCVVDRATMGQQLRLDLNRLGTGLRLTDGSVRRWTGIYEGSDPRDWVLALEAALGLTAQVGGLPPGTPSSLAVRWIAQLMLTQLGSRERWHTVGGIPATPEEFPGLVGSAEGSRTDTRYWTIGPGEGQDVTIRQPRAVVSIEGRLHLRGADPISLTEHHRSGGSITALVAKTAPDLLP